MEEIIHAVEFKNPYENSIEKRHEIIESVENNYKIIGRVYQHIYADITDNFFEYIHSLDPDEISTFITILKLMSGELLIYLK